MTEQRSNHRYSLMLFADLRVADDRAVSRIRVRNLSPAGMMGEGLVLLRKGQAVTLEINPVGRVAGHVAWVQGERFGVAFAQPVDLPSARRLQSLDERVTPRG